MVQAKETLEVLERVVYHSAHLHLIVSTTYWYPIKPLYVKHVWELISLLMVVKNAELHSDK